MKPENFINKAELDEYNKKDRYRNRYGFKINSDYTVERYTKKSIEGSTKNVAIEDVIADTAREHINKSSSNSKLITVEMNEEDGMSWFSQKLYDSKHSVYPHFHFFNIFKIDENDLISCPQLLM